LLDTTKTQLDDAQVRIEGNISDIEDVNLTRAMTLLAQNQTTLSSSFAVTARLQQVSLLNFLR
jgi:flagellin-like hook-associated protein FlgL